jgi:hypothetical protein
VFIKRMKVENNIWEFLFLEIYVIYGSVLDFII